VLAIDDDPDTRDLLQRGLGLSNMSVVTAENMEDGVLIAQALHPDIIILDVALPDGSGWEVLRVLKDDPELMDIPVIMLTVVDERNRGLGLGAAEYLVKPIETDQLVELINTLLPRDVPTGAEAVAQKPAQNDLVLDIR
jgi:DNA-binding response OmpR family regulator